MPTIANVKISFEVKFVQTMFPWDRCLETWTLGVGIGQEPKSVVSSLWSEVYNFNNPTTYVPLNVGLGLWSFNSTFNNISVISWRSILLVEEARVPGENHRPVASHWQTLSHNVASSTPRLRGIRTHNFFIGDRHRLHR